MAILHNSFYKRSLLMRNPQSHVRTPPEGKIKPLTQEKTY